MSGLPWGREQAGGGSSAASPPRSPLTGPGTTLLPTLAAATVAAASSSSPSPARRALVVVSRRSNGAAAAAAAGPAGAIGAGALASADSGADRYFDALAGSRPVSDDDDACGSLAGGAGGGSDRAQIDGGGGNGGDEEDEDYTPSSSGSGYTDDLIDEILENYRFTLQPEVRVKLRRRWVGFWLGLRFRLVSSEGGGAARARPRLGAALGPALPPKRHPSISGVDLVC